MTLGEFRERVAHVSDHAEIVLREDNPSGFDYGYEADIFDSDLVITPSKVTILFPYTEED